MLQDFVDLAEALSPTRLEEFVVKESALVGSILKVAARLNQRGLSIDGKPLESDDISNIITSSPSNERHKIVRASYLKKTRHMRRKISPRHYT